MSERFLFHVFWPNLYVSRLDDDVDYIALQSVIVSEPQWYTTERALARLWFLRSTWLPKVLTGGVTIMGESVCILTRRELWPKNKTKKLKQKDSLQVEEDVQGTDHCDMILCFRFVQWNKCMHICMQTYTHTHTHAYMHARMYTHTHTQTHTQCIHSQA